MDKEENINDFLHSISNDIAIAEGCLKLCCFKECPREEKDEFLDKSLERLESLSKKVREFKASRQNPF